MKRFYNIVMTFLLVILSLARSPQPALGLGDHAQAFLLPTATITGTVLDENGYPFPNAIVTVRDYYNDLLPQMGATTAPDGTFQISGLTPKAYRVMASTSEPGYLTTYYDSVVSWYDATPLKLAPGQIFSGLTMKMYRDHPSTHLQVWLNDNRIEGVNWPMFVPITVTIDDPDIPGAPDYEETTQSYGNFSLNLYNNFKLKSGQIVTARTDYITRRMEITPLVLSGVDRIQDVVFGWAVPGSFVQVNAYNPENQGREIDKNIVRYAQADGDGKWSVDFSQPGPQPGEENTWDITIGSQVLVTQADEAGNETVQFWYVRTPTIGVRPDTETIVGREWPAGATVLVKVDDPNTDQNPDRTASGVPDWVPSDPGHTLFTIRLADYDLKVGDVVTVSDGETIRQHTVQYVAITNVDQDADTVYGSATLERFVFAHVCDQDHCVYAEGSAWEGDWSINFSDPDQTLGGTFDIGPGSWVYAAVMEENEDGDVTEAYFEVPLNEPPSNVVITAPLAPVPVNQAVTTQVSFSDPDENQAHTVLLDWGDGTSSQVTTGDLAVSMSHQYATAGVYTLQATVTDPAGESAQATYQYLVVYDTKGGYVTGSGWIQSPPGAYVSDPTLSGKATFGIVSKYQKGATVPTGTTTFQFKVGDLSFKSTSYDWLVIAGSKAQYKGTGTINNAGSYGFLLSSIDGSPDSFRIKIWEKSSGALIYDNMLGVAEDAAPTTAIEEGSIVIHK